MTTCLHFDHLKFDTFDAVVFSLPVYHILRLAGFHVPTERKTNFYSCVPLH